MKSTDLVEQPVSTKNYQIYNINELPKALLCIRCNSKFDEKRLQIKRTYKPKLVSHFEMISQLEPIFLYGIEINVEPSFYPLIDTLNDERFIPRNKISSSPDFFVQSYSHLLKKYDLSCNDCFGFLKDGVYPVDIKHLNTISKKDFTSEIRSGFRSMIRKPLNTPWCINVLNFNILILTKATGYNEDYRLTHTTK
jgi:hypothetical protein